LLRKEKSPFGKTGGVHYISFLIGCPQAAARVTADVGPAEKKRVTATRGASNGSGFALK
jgi:hypothetical protein